MDFTFYSRVVYKAKMLKLFPGAQHPNTFLRYNQCASVQKNAHKKIGPSQLHELVMHKLYASVFW